MQHDRRPVAPRLQLVAAASVKLLIHSHDRCSTSTSDRRTRPPIANHDQLRQSEIQPVKIRSPCSTSVVGNRSQRHRHPLNAPYRQLPPPCLVINRSRDTIRSSSRRSSSCSSRSRGATAGQPGRPHRPSGYIDCTSAARRGCLLAACRSTIYNGRHRSFCRRLMCANKIIS